jgi:hypothetical protein
MYGTTVVPPGLAMLRVAILYAASAVLARPAKFQVWNDE